MTNAATTPLLERQLLLQLGERLRRLRQAQALGTVQMAQRVGISRTTLAAVEAGDPGPSIGTYLRVMSVLGIAGDMQHKENERGENREAANDCMHVFCSFKRHQDFLFADGSQRSIRSKPASICGSDRAKENRTNCLVESP